MTIKLAIASGYAFEHIALLWIGYETFRRRAFTGRGRPLGAGLEVLKPTYSLFIYVYISFSSKHNYIYMV